MIVADPARISPTSTGGLWRTSSIQSVLYVSLVGIVRVDQRAAVQLKCTVIPRRRPSARCIYFSHLEFDNRRAHRGVKAYTCDSRCGSEQAQLAKLTHGATTTHHGFGQRLVRPSLAVPSLRIGCHDPSDCTCLTACYDSDNTSNRHSATPRRDHTSSRTEQQLGALSLHAYAAYRSRMKHWYTVETTLGKCVKSGKCQSI
ncbi:hypothetical protein C8Q74DRAFT_402667 [Fomes fomentarius]|nr:hypothetical protein C8Q74DRAFT_402667 [Fomes fomentarius]